MTSPIARPSRLSLGHMLIAAFSQTCVVCVSDSYRRSVVWTYDDNLIALIGRTVQGRVQPVRLGGGAISAIFGRQAHNGFATVRGMK